MKRKTLEKLQKRFLALPLHHIDTDVIIESTSETKLGEICADYLNRVGYKYRGTISLPVLGEFLLITLRDSETIEEKWISLNSFDRLIEKRKIEFVTPLKSAYQIAVEIMNTDSRIEPTDALNYAIAVQENAKTFVTFDENLVENKSLESKFGVRLVHPKDL